MLEDPVYLTEMSARIRIYPLVIGFSFLISHVFSDLSYGQLVINEIMADNLRTIADPDYGNYADWLEIYNPGNARVDISGYFLSDDPASPQKWTFPSGTTIAANGFLLVWLDNESTGLHTGFRLSKSGESVLFHSASNVLLDQVDFGEQIEDVSYGRNPDGGEDWVFFESPTPGSTNNATNGDLVTAKPVFSLESGFYSGSQLLTLTPQSVNARIYYTLDGSDPTTSSRRYNQPIRLDETTVVRAFKTQEGYISSPVVTKTILINEPTTLPVFSIVTDPDNLWDLDDGIYVEGRNYSWGWGNGNFWQDWEKPCFVEFWESDRELKVSQGCGLKITGALTRTASQKSLRLIARSEYGKTKFDYRFFKDKDISSFNDIVLRSSGNDWAKTMMADGLMQTIVAGQMDIDYQSYRPAILFLNGQYWGIHNIREKVGDDYLEENHGFPKDNIDLLSQLDDIRDGDRTQYDALLNYITSHDLNVASNYDYVKQRVDLQEYVNYYVSQIFFANHDWPAGNIKYWRPRTDPSKWRWILFDTDLAFQQPFLNTIAWVTDPNPAYQYENDFFRGLMTSREFQQLFLNTYQYLMATTFETNRVLGIIDSLQATIQPEMSRHIDRWKNYHGWTFVYAVTGDSIATPALASYTDWIANVNTFRTFARNRPDELNQFMADHFGIGQPVDITLALETPGTGKIWVNQDKATDDRLNLVYFTNQELELIPLNNVNSVFDHWTLEQGFYKAGDLVPLVPRNSTWKYLDSGEYPGNSWITTEFDDKHWKDGAGILGYAIDNLQTEISFGADAANKHISTWFRKEFSVANVSDWQSLQFQLLRDDGALVFLNGQQIIRSNLPDGADHKTTASTGVDDVDENRYFTFEIPANKLVRGTNVIAVEIHQVSATSSDLGFDLQLRGKASRAMGNQNQLETDTINVVISDKALYTARFIESDQPASLSLNEVMADNNTKLITPYGRTPEWFEIYNPNDYAIDVGGLYVTDNLLNPDKYRIPANQPVFTNIAPKGFITLIADGNRLYNAGYADIQLSSEGEELALYQKINAEYRLIDSIFYPYLSTDVSFGRYPDGEDEWFLFTKSPTPGRANKINNQEIPDLPVFLMQNYPNPFNDQTTIVFGNREDATIRIEIRDLQGNLINTITDRVWPAGQHEVIWKGDKNSGGIVNSGLYLIVLRSGFYAKVVKSIFIQL